jgi:hypothetical protein
MAWYFVKHRTTILYYTIYKCRVMSSGMMFIVRLIKKLWVPGDLSLGVKWPGREADHSPSSAEVKE